jgi:membrane protease subunit HflK
MDEMPNIPNININEIKKKLGGAGRTALIAVIMLVVIITAFNSYYILQSGEEAVVIRLGSHNATVISPGLHFKMPFIDEAQRVSTQTIHHLEFGFRSVPGSDNIITTPDILREAVMLTRDENLVVADWAILYRIRDPFLSIYKIEDLERTLRILSESSYRRVVASHPLDYILTDMKDMIQSEVLVDLQALCDKYDTGVLIITVQLQDAMPPDAVKPAFLDVVSAREEREAKINDANRYANEKIPIARGDAEKLINEAEGYRKRRINEADGDVARYISIQAEYAKNKDIMRTRLYLEMIREVFPQLKSITIVDEGNMMKFLPIGDGLSEALR